MANTINVNQNNNNVSLQDNNRRIIITDNNAGTTINVTQPVTSIITISALGPQGAQGPTGEIPSTGSFVLTSSFNAFTASYYVDSASFETQILSNSSSITLLSGSFETTSGSFSTRITNLENFSSSLDATFATDAELNIATASLSASIANLSSNFEIFSGSYNTGSFTGSFYGDGSNLTGIIPSKWTGSNPISRDSNVEITGSLKVKTGVIELNTATGQLIRSGIDLVNWPSGTLNDFSGNTSINWGTREILDSSGIISIDWDSRGTWDSSNTASIDWDNRQLIKSDGSTITVDWENEIFTGSLHGTASWAENAISSSYALSSSHANHATSASYAESASYAITSSYAQTSSYVNPLNQNVIITGSILMTGSINQVNYIDFNTGSSTPSWHSGRVYWNNTDGCLDVYNAESDITLQVGQENWTRVSNRTGVTITNGTVVRIIGAHGDVPEVTKAQSIAISGSINMQNQILGIATHDIENNSKGYITTQGLVRGINTNNFNEGDILFVSSESSGILTNIPPQSPFEIIPVCVVVKVGPGGSGIIYVTVKEPIDFADLSSVESNSNYSYGDLWTYVPSGSYGIWRHTNQLSGSYGLTGSLTVSGSLVSTQIGVGTLSSSSVRLDVRAQGALSTDTIFRIRNSANTTDLISFRGDGSEWIQSVPFRHAAYLTGGTNIAQGLFIGYNVASLSSTSDNCVIIGRGTGNTLQGSGNTIIGHAFSQGTVNNSIGLGRGVFVNGSNQFIVGSELYPTNTWLVSTGGEVTTGANLRGLDFKVSGTATGPSNVSASPYPIRFYSPNGTGNGSGSNIQFHVAPSNTGGTFFNKNIFSEIFTIRGEADGLNHYQLSTPRIPSASITDGYIQYSNDITAGNAAPHFRTENGSIIKLYKEIQPALSGSANTGDAATDALINAMKTIILNLGLGSSS